MPDSWYDDHADSFAEATVIELPFIGMNLHAQDRLNWFKLWPINSAEYVEVDGRRVLDFGAGHGRLALAFPDIASYVGVDFSSRLVTMGRIRLERAGLSCRAQLEQADCSSWVGPAEDFDVVCSLGMFCHLSDPLAMVRKMAMHLRPGGVLFVDFRLASPLWALLRQIKWRFAEPTGGTRGGTTWTPTAMEQMLIDAGLCEPRLLMREYPLLAEMHAKLAWRWPVTLRNAIAHLPAFRFLATEGWAFARKPLQ